MRIIHFSDIHAGGWVRSWRGYFDKRLLGALNYYLRRHRHHDWAVMAPAVARIIELKPDIVICTGDLSSISAPAEFEQALTALQPLTDASFEFLYVPGNHDCYVRDPACYQSYLEAYAEISRGRRSAADLPCEVRLGDVSFLMINEAQPMHWLSSAGIVDRGTGAWVLERLQDDGGPHVLVHHFPLFDRHGLPLGKRRACRQNIELQTALVTGALDISLCGHIHTPFARKHDGGGAEYCAGSLTFARQLNVLDYDSETQTFTQRWEKI